MPAPFEVNTMLSDTYEPKRSNRFIFQFADDALPAFIVKTAARPTYTVNPITIDYLNQKRYLAGKGEWGEIQISMYDPIAPSAAQKVMEWVRLQHETISGRDGYAAFYKKNFSLIALDPVGAAVEKWEIRGAWCSSVEFGQYDMANDEPLTVDITVRPDECILSF